ncbi:flagellar protein FlaG [Texcoconibacillus texcoconensis]|uniref:Flagellar protein FlaG n=1 Tax=Texcoconibacillus texcoconensis TaxID=1095777 RepID=A0A840QPX8_9BACI|nr:flagellar protein FlaG [Texcoconibacillus texcoconensis]MBB5173398.1 flagellar protein FlaG [Texcoconibacillus texcoconensis]
MSSDRKGHEGEKTVSESIRETVKKGQDQSWDRETLEEKVEGMNEFMAKNFRDLEFQIHDQLDRVYVQVMERGTDEIIREVPPEKFLDMVASMMESVGMLVDERL